MKRVRPSVGSGRVSQLAQPGELLDTRPSTSDGRFSSETTTTSEISGKPSTLPEIKDERIMDRWKPPALREKGKYFKCPMCLKTARRKSLINAHVANEHEQRRCKYCLFKTINANILTQHEQKHLDGLNSLCEGCEITNEEEQVLRCNFCSYCVPSFGCLNRHFILTHYYHTDNYHWFLCNNCGSRTRYFSLLLHHLERCQRNKWSAEKRSRPNYQCHVCNKCFENVEECKRHRDWHRKRFKPI